MRSTRGAQRREVKVVPLGVSVFTGCEKMPVRSAIHFRWPLTAQLRSSCLGVIDLQPVQAVDCRSRSTVYGSPAFCAVARPVCHCWCDSSHLVVVVLVLQPASCRLQLLCFTLFTCAPRSASHAVRSSPCYHQSLRMYPLFCFAVAAHTNTASN